MAASKDTSVRYRNKKTHVVVTYAQPIPRLEKSDDWERISKTAAKSSAKD